MEDLSGIKSGVDFMSIVNTLPLVVWTAAPDGGLTYISKQWEDIYGNPLDQSLGNGWAKFVHPDDVEKAGALWANALQTGKKYETEFRVQHKTTGYQWILVRALPKHNASGEIISWNGSNTDINDQKITEEEARKSEARFRTMADNIPNLAWMANADGWIYWYNKKWYDYTGTIPEQMEGWGWQSVHDPIELPRVLENWQTSVKNGEAFEMVFPLKGSDGKFRQFLTRVLPVRDDAGQIQQWFGSNTDVTEQVNARKQIEETETFLRGAIELANLGTWTLDLKTRILDYDKRLRNWFGFSDDEIIDVEKAYSPIFDEDKGLVKESMTNALTPATDGIYNVEYKIKNLKDSSVKIIHAQGKAVLNDKNEIYKITGTAQDVTNERNIEIELTKQVQQRTEELAASNEELQATNEEIAATNEELEEANIKLQSSNAELEQFAYIASHDLQEPVRKISTFTEMLEKSLGNVNERSLNYLDKIKGSTQRMTTLIRDVLAYSQLSGINEIYDRVNLSQIIDEVTNDFELAIEQKQAVIKYSGLPIIEAIPLQMSQLFSNLLSNALKYSKAGVSPEINITAEVVTKDEVTKHDALNSKKSYYKIQFSDNGIGIKSEQIDRIFSIFQRLHAKTEYAGTGIGLSICKKIVLNHHGHISAFSYEGEGTTFNIILPRHFRKKIE